MYVIADIEWIQNDMRKRCPTQLSAAKVDDEWNVIDEYGAFIRPLDKSFYKWDHVAYTGGIPNDYIFANGCYSVLTEFENWMDEDDILCWWSVKSKNMFDFLSNVVLKKQVVRKTVVLSEYMPQFLEGQQCVLGSPYKLAKHRNIDVPEIEHNSYNDVTAILNLLTGINFPQEALTKEPQLIDIDYDTENYSELNYFYDIDNKLLHKKDCGLLSPNANIHGYATLNSCIKKGYAPCICLEDEYRKAKIKKNADAIQNSPFCYVFTQTSKVFHRKDCHLIHNASRFIGTSNYEAAIARGLRPCKVCCPSLEDQHNQARLNSRIRVMTDKKLARKKLSREETMALARLNQAQNERKFGVLKANMSKQEVSDVYTLTQPRFVFFASKGCKTFHCRECAKLSDRSNIVGFDTFDKAIKAGYVPCKTCKPTSKRDMKISIPIDNQIRCEEKLSEVTALCRQLFLEYSIERDYLLISTDVGKWKINTVVRPVEVEHINLAMTPESTTYHRQHRVFLSITDAIRYIVRHDTELANKRGDNE